MSEIQVDTVAEKTSANGVTVDGLNIKDSKLVTANSVVAANITADAVDATKIADDAISEEHLDVTSITGHGALTSVANDDLVLISDTSASAALKKMTVANLVANAGGGKVLQVISATDSTTRTTTSTSYVTGSNSMTVTITPASTSSKIFIIATFGAHKNSGVSAYTVFRGGSAISGAPAVMALLKMVNDMPQNGAFNFLDSPSSTSELVYQFMFRSVQGSNASSINPSNGAQSTGNFTVMEIGG